MKSQLIYLFAIALLLGTSVACGGTQSSAFAYADPCDPEDYDEDPSGGGYNYYYVDAPGTGYYYWEYAIDAYAEARISRGTVGTSYAESWARSTVGGNFTGAPGDVNPAYVLLAKVGLKNDAPSTKADNDGPYWMTPSNYLEFTHAAWADVYCGGTVNLDAGADAEVAGWITENP